MQSTILLALILTGLISLASLFWFSYKYIDTYLGAKATRLNSRFDSLVAQSRGYTLTNIKDQDARSLIFQKLDSTQLIEHLRSQIIKSGLKLQVDTFLGGCLVTGLFSSLIGYTLMESFQVIFPILCIGTVAPYFILKFFVRRRQSLLESQLPELLDFISRSLQVGHSLNTSLQMVSNESPMPIAAEFKKVSEELNYGSSLEKTLHNLAERIECIEIRFFVIAIVVNREIGGNLSEILKKVSSLIRERMELRQTIRVLTSEGRASGAVLGVLPFLIGGLIFYINPESYTLMINDPLGRKLFLYAGTLMIFGFFWINRLCVIED
jgi:tight adherence protein B